MSPRIRRSLTGLGLVLLGACRTVDAITPQATIHFALHAPLCSSRVAVQFFIDSKQVATDTFVVGLRPEHGISRGFTTLPGRHTLGARAVGGPVWPDTNVTLVAGEVFLDSLPFYCS